MQEQSEKNIKDSITEKLLNSPAVNSLKLETTVYDAFQKLGWEVNHSPYYTDKETKKFREVDITARKYWTTSDLDDFRCNVCCIVECKSIKDYHIIVSKNSLWKYGDSLIMCWVGDDFFQHNRKIISLIENHNIGDEQAEKILRNLHAKCFPNGTINFIKYRLESFDIPAFNSFRETNIGTTKELDNSVVWKSFQSLYSCIEKYHDFVWDGTEFELYDSDREKILTPFDSQEKLHNMLMRQANHVTFIHPMLVVESNLWEVTSKGLSKLKYLRLVFQKLFDEEIWIDVIDINHLDEYLKKTKQYDRFLKKRGLESGL